MVSTLQPFSLTSVVIWLMISLAPLSGVVVAFSLWLGHQLPNTVLAFSSDQEDNREIYLMDVRASQSLNLTNHPADDCCLTWSPDGKQIAFTSLRDGIANIYMMDFTGFHAQRVTDIGGTWPVWSPDGSHIAFISYSNSVGDIYMIDADGSNLQQITRNEPIYERPTWSPNGRYIVYTPSASSTHPVDNIYVVDTLAQTEDCTRLLAATTSSECLESSRAMTQNGGFLPIWSPGGSRIAFILPQSLSGRLYLMDTNGDDSRQLTDLPLTGVAPAWSTDGQNIAFTVKGSRHQLEIYILEVDGNSTHQLTDNMADDVNPVWSADDRLIAFISNRDGNNEIYVMNADGSDQRRLTWNDGDDVSPSWMP